MMITSKLNLVCCRRKGPRHRHFSPTPEEWVGHKCGAPIRRNGIDRKCESVLKLIDPRVAS